MVGRTSATLICVVCLASAAIAATFPQVEGWEPAGESRTYGPDGLWELIDGAAEVYLAYGFQELATGELKGESVTVTLNVFDMGTPLNAYGIFGKESAGATSLDDVGAAAALSPPFQALLLKDKYYVKVDAYEGDVTEAIGIRLLKKIEKAIPGSTTLPEALDMLPEKDRVDGSRGFTRTGYLGLSELKNCVHANYKSGDTEYEAFVISPPAKYDPATIWDGLGPKWAAVQHETLKIKSREVPYRGPVGVVMTDRGIFGVSGIKAEAELIEKLAALAAGG